MNKLDSCHQPPRGESRNQKLHSSWRMMTITGSFLRGKRIDPRPRRQMQNGKLAEASCGQPLPNTLQLSIEGLTQSKICVISQLATRHGLLLFSYKRLTAPRRISKWYQTSNQLAGLWAGSMVSLRLFMRDSVGPLLISLWKDQL